MAEKEKPQRGLPAIQEARDLREQRRKSPSAPGSFWVWSLIALAAITIFYWKKTTSENDRVRARVLAKQRAVATEVGPLYQALRDKVEAFTMQVAKDDWDDDVVEPPVELEAARKGDKGEKRDPALFKRPGVYLRLSRPNALTPAKIRAASQHSLRDAFSACLLRVPHLDARGGKDCQKSKDCDPKQICNEVNVCSHPTQPYNMRILYRGLRLLDPDWTRDVETAGEELRLRLREAEVDDAKHSDIPVAIDLLKQAEYFLVVIDDVPEGIKPEDGGTLEQAVQSEVHPTRVGILDLRGGKVLFRAKRTIDVAIPVVAGAIEAQRRQVLNCALAQDVRETLSR